MRALLVVAMMLSPVGASGQELVEGRVEIVRAEVVQILMQETQLVPGTDLPATYQSIRARVLEGEQSGEVAVIENDYLVLKPGDVFYARRYMEGGHSTYNVLEPYRLPQLFILAGLFVSLVAVFGGGQGLRGLAALALSVLFIFYILLPAMSAGYDPALVSIGAASLIVIAGSYITHGISRMTTTAVLGMVAAIGATGLLASLAIGWTRMTGLSEDESTYLLLNSRGGLDLAGLYLGGILIGLLGALYDAAIGQSVAVDELRHAAPDTTDRELFARALRVGREHIGALVNTLAIAYVGASLPLLLFFYGAPDANVFEILNRELFASEILRIIVSSIGVVLVVPLTTAIAVAMLRENSSYKPHSHGHRH